MSEVTYIVNSDKPYPPWIKEHRVFKFLPKIDKIFPRIGLPNFTQSINVYSTEAAKANAREVVIFVQQELTSKVSDLKKKLNSELLLSGKDRNDKCNATQAAINILNSTYTSIYCKELVSISEGKTLISLPSDVFNGASSTPIFKKGETLFKVLNKINIILAEIGALLKIDYERNEYFKEYSKLNVPSREYKMTFSSTGSDGAWDIATASMRGIVSCQAWTAAQSRGLIGSISSKYVGIVFISGSSDYPPYGKQMMFRSIVRLVINRASGLPALYLDTMYPSYNVDIYNTIKKILEKKSGIPVFASNAGDRDRMVRDYHLLDEISRTYLREGEYSYMDSIIPIENRKTPLFTQKNNKILLERRGFFVQKLEKLIAEKRASYIKNVNELKIWAASENKDEGKKPEMSPLFLDLKKGQYSFKNILNFLSHCDSDKTHPTSNKPTTYFLLEIFKVIGSSDQQFVSAKDCDLWMLKNLVNNYSSIKEKSWAVISAGTWMKSFPASTKRFHETILSDLKKELLLSCKSNA